MAKIINFKGKPDPKVKIYIETADHIFQLCLKKAKPDKYGSIYNGLANDILEKLQGSNYIFEDDIDGKYLTNTNSRIEAAKKANELFIGFGHTYILRLALFAGIEDYVAFDEKNGPTTGIPALFTARPFKFFELIRVPLFGLLFENDNAWEYKNDGDLITSGNVNEISKYIMPGDRNPLWIEVKYDGPNGGQTAYFSEDSLLIHPVSESGRLFRFFSKKISLS
jgi:hypothetical protein